MGAKIGHIITQGTKRKISLSLKGRFAGKNNPFYGRKHNQETIEKIREARKKQISPFKGHEHTMKARLLNSLAHRGEKHPRWKGGINDVNDSIRKSLRYRLWREKVFERDNYTCQIYKAKSGSGETVILNADHIKPFALYPELRFVVSNGKTNCEDCHRKTETFGWKTYHNKFIFLTPS